MTWWQIVITVVFGLLAYAGIGFAAANTTDQMLSTRSTDYSDEWSFAMFVLWPIGLPIMLTIFLVKTPLFGKE